jgi:GTPase Era involved in 16S rRNA processing
MGLLQISRNKAGFNDYRPEVNAQCSDYLNHSDVFVLVVDSSISGTDVAILKKVKGFATTENILICLNKVDLARNEMDRARLLDAAHERSSGHTIIETVFDSSL